MKRAFSFAFPAFIDLDSQQTAFSFPAGNRGLSVRLFAALILLSAAFFAGAQTAHPISGRTTVGGGFSEPLHLAVDAGGDLFVSDAENIAIYEVLAVDGAIPESPTIRVLYRPSANPQGIAVDVQGNVYFTTLDVYSNLGNNSVTELVAENGVIPSSPVVRQLGNGLNYPNTVAVDKQGDVFVTDSSHSLVKEFVAVNGVVPTSPTILTLGSGFSDPRGIAVDSLGNVYVSDSGNEVVKEILAVNGIIPASPMIVTLGSGFCGPWDIALNATGDLYVADYCDAAIFELPAANGAVQPGTTPVEVASGLNGVEGVAVSPYSTLYAGNVVNGVTEITPSPISFGSVKIGSIGPTVAQTFVFDSGGVLGPVSVLTGGASSKDFTNAGTGTCTPNATYATGQSCTVNVSFAPKFSGMRNGAVELNDTNGNVIATAYLQGTGVGPQIDFSPGTQTTLGGSFEFASAVAVDGSGDVYVIDTINNLGNVQEIMAVNGSIPFNPTLNTLVSGIDCPSGLALDAAGNLYFADLCSRTVNEIQAVNGNSSSSPTVRTLTTQFVSPVAVAVDRQGNVYVADASNNTISEIIAVNGIIPASPAITTVASGFQEIDDIAVDGSGNVYVSDDTSREVFEIYAINGSIPASPVMTSLGSGFVIPRGIAVDASGNVYVAEYYYNTVFEILAINGNIPPSPTILSLGTGFIYADGVAVDANRNVFVADYGDARLLRLDYADPPSLTFANTSVGSISADSPQTVIFENNGNAQLSFLAPATGDNPSITPNFTLASSAQSDCPLIPSGSTETGILQPGTSCELPISFTPSVSGSLSGSLILVDNNLNAGEPAYAMQTIALSGTALQATAQITWGAPGAISYGTVLSSAQLDASANVPGTFVYSPAAGTVLNAGTQTLTATFTPTDTNDYTTAVATVPLTVNAATQTISFAPPTTVAYGGSPMILPANASSGLAVTLSLVSGPATLSGDVLTITGLGSISLTATQSGNANYLAATPVSATIVVTQGVPSISWPTPGAISYGTALSATQLDATSSIPGTFVYTPAAGKVLPPGTQTLSVTFTPSNLTDYAKATATVELMVQQLLLEITWSNPASIKYGKALSSTQLDAKASVSGTFTYSPPSGTVLNAGTQTLSVTFTPKNSTDYTSASASVQLIVTQASQTISFAKPASPVSKSSPPITLNATATSGLPVAFSVQSGPATVRSSTLVLTGATGTVVIVATQPGNSNYSAADPVDRSITVN